MSSRNFMGAPFGGRGSRGLLPPEIAVCPGMRYPACAGDLARPPASEFMSAVAQKWRGAYSFSESRRVVQKLKSRRSDRGRAIMRLVLEIGRAFGVNRGTTLIVTEEVKRIDKFAAYRCSQGDEPALHRVGIAVVVTPIDKL